MIFIFTILRFSWFFISEKRTLTLQNGTAPIGSISELKGSPPAKKLVPKRTLAVVATPQEKSPLKGKLKKIFPSFSDPEHDTDLVKSFY